LFIEESSRGKDRLVNQYIHVYDNKHISPIVRNKGMVQKQFRFKNGFSLFYLEASKSLETNKMIVCDCEYKRSRKWGKTSELIKNEECSVNTAVYNV
jgi:hypothetical protein